MAFDAPLWSDCSGVFVGASTILGGKIINPLVNVDDIFSAEYSFQSKLASVMIGLWVCSII
jgi:hypothetical protein